jgi:hypothetical protein
MVTLRTKPSTRARERSYVALRHLMNFLLKLNIAYYDIDMNTIRDDEFYDIDDIDDGIDFLGWKQWANTYTPKDKRGGVGNFK